MSLRQPERLLASIVIPALLLIFFSVVKINLVRGADVDALLPGALAVALIGSAMTALGIATGFEKRYGVLKRLASTPLGRGRLIAAKVSALLAFEVIQILLLIALGFALGWNGEIKTGLVVVVVAGTLAFGGLGMLLAGTMPAETNLAVTNAIFLFLMLTCGAFVPLDALPGPLSGAGTALPGVPLTSLMRWALEAGPFITADALRLATWAAITPVAGALTFRWE